MKYLLTIVCFIVYATSNATDYQVASEADLKSALAKAKAGDVIIWKNGTYNNITINFETTAKGTVNQPIILKTQTAGKAVFTGNSQLLVKGDYLKAEGFLFEGISTLTSENGDVMAFGSNAAHCRITNCAVVNYTPKDELVNNNWISLQGTFNEVDHCYFTGKTNQGPYLVVRYKKEKGYVDGSDVAVSTHHHIHHNYFGYRTLPTDNGGEDMRIGDSFTSFTHGFNIIEYNYFEDHRLEAEVISNKSWDNIYRFNTFIGNDGQMVLRHGQKCFVYGNYFDGKSGRNTSGGIRIINANQTVFNNYITNAEGSEKDVSKAGIVIMCGLVESPLNGYYPADNAVIAYNTAVNCVGPVVKIGYGNKSKGKPFTSPQNLVIVSNLIINSLGNKSKAAIEIEPVTYSVCSTNFYTNGGSDVKGFSAIIPKNITTKAGFKYAAMPVNQAIIDTINQRLKIHNIKLSTEDITHFNPAWQLDKKDVGVNWKL